MDKRSLVLRLLDPQSKELLLAANLGPERYPPLMQAYLDRNYYTRERAARAIFHLNISEGRIAEMAKEVNDTYLRSQRVPGGVESYSQVTRLLVALDRQGGLIQ